MLWYAAEPLAAVDAKRAIEMAEKSKMSKHLPYMIQRVTALGTEDSKKLLKELKDRLGKSHSHENHESMMLIDTALGK
jgi:Flp pilus assembly CpaE family ATPase